MTTPEDPVTETTRPTREQVVADLQRMALQMLTDKDYAGWRYTCREHEWMSQTVPCPGGDGTVTTPAAPEGER